eukprot:EG_transcript_55566
MLQCCFDALLLESVLTHLPSQELSNVLLVCRPWKHFLEDRLHFCIYERSSWSSSNNLRLTSNSGGFLGACASFPAARQRLLDAFETYEQLLKDELESFSLLNTSNGCNFTFFIMFS